MVRWRSLLGLLAGRRRNVLLGLANGLLRRCDLARALNRNLGQLAYLLGRSP